MTGQTKMSIRMIRHYFRKLGGVENICEKGNDKRHFIVTFTNVEGR